jgi:hypothetical protein
LKLAITGGLGRERENSTKHCPLTKKKKNFEPFLVTLRVGREYSQEPISLRPKSNLQYVLYLKTMMLESWLLGSWIRIPLKAWMFVRVFLCCVVLCR